MPESTKTVAGLGHVHRRGEALRADDQDEDPDERGEASLDHLDEADYPEEPAGVGLLGLLAGLLWHRRSLPLSVSGLAATVEQSSRKGVRGAVARTCGNSQTIS
jgi:hypothetical protein